MFLFTYLGRRDSGSTFTLHQQQTSSFANPTAGRRIRAAPAPPAALRSAVAALISILALSFRFMSGSLTCFKPAVYRHLLPPPSSCLFTRHSLLRLVLCSCRFFFCCSFFGGFVLHLPICLPPFCSPSPLVWTLILSSNEQNQKALVFSGCFL